MTARPLSATGRTQLRRHRERGRPERADLYAVLDAGMICHLGVVAHGAPVVLPTAYGRAGDTLYLHGSSANQSFQAAAGHEVCVTVTHVDGLVCARSAFSHSINYRCAVVFGTARVVTGQAERLEGLRAVTEHLIPGRWDAVREPSRKELTATSVLAVPLGEASVKVRTGPPGDDPADLGLPVWAGVVPMTVSFGRPEADPALRPGIAIPDHIRALAGRGGAPAVAHENTDDWPRTRA
jgi:nitroimidazol reductase NimA-like FMN-containing flavoprotein (pyridoxamine 5'-phosphate oxidase superfamily)